MNQEAKTKLAEFELSLKENQNALSVDQLPSFPYLSMDEVRGAYSSGQITLQPAFLSGLAEALGTRLENKIIGLTKTIPIAIIIFFVVAGLSWEIDMLWGVLFAWVGWSRSQTLGKRTGCLSFVVVVGLVVAIASSAYAWVWILVGMALSSYFPSVSREQVRMILVGRALASECFFCHLKLKNWITVRHLQTGKVL